MSERERGFTKERRMRKGKVLSVHGRVTIVLKETANR